MEISGFEKGKGLICIEEFCYCQRIDEHEECRFSALVSERYIENCVDMLEKECAMRDDAFQFTGTVTSVAVTRRMDCCRVEGIVCGKTLRYDQEPHNRVFQSESKTLSGILRKLGITDISCSGENDKDIPAMLVQDDETDWHFLKRLAAYTGTHLFPGEKIWFGAPLEETEHPKDDDFLELWVELDSKQSSAVCRIRAERSAKPLLLGTRVRLNGRVFFIDGVSYRKYREEYCYEYHLREVGKNPMPAALPLYILPAKVTDNADPDKKGRVKLAFQEPYEDMTEDTWIPCGSLWASGELGIACVPRKDDLVDVRILNGSPLVTQSRRETAFHEQFADPDTRYLFASKDTWLKVDSEEIKVENSAYTCIINGDQFSLSFGKNLSIVIEDGKLTAHMGKTDLELADETKLITQGLQIDGKKTAAITASKVEIKGKNEVSIN